MSKNMKLTINDIGGVVVKSNDTYEVKDNTQLNNLVISSTLLHPGKQTTGHTHPGQEEVYYFVSGKGLMKIEEAYWPVFPGDIMLIEDGEFHQVINEGDEDMYFVCVFDGKRTHK
jgi:mannose-6-phosphate isomerase-like protein (cupin superfamily)